MKQEEKKREGAVVEKDKSHMSFICGVCVHVHNMEVRVGTSKGRKGPVGKETREGNEES